MLPLPHWRRELDGQLARTNTPHRLWRLRLVAACAAEELHGPRGEHAPRASPSRAGVVWVECAQEQSSALFSVQ